MNETKNEAGGAHDEFDMAPLLTNDKMEDNDLMKAQRAVALGLKIEPCSDQILTSSNK